MGGLRRSELTALTWTDIEDQADGIAVHVRRPKTNYDGSRPDTRFVKNRSARAIRGLGKLRAESGRTGTTTQASDSPRTPWGIGSRRR